MDKKIIDEILEVNPELKKDKDKLNEVIIALEKLNPKIEASTSFKSDLKSKLDTIQNTNNAETIKKPFLFLIPLFSLFFIMGLGIYLYKDINFLEQEDLNFKSERALDANIGLGEQFNDFGYELVWESKTEEVAKGSLKSEEINNGLSKEPATNSIIISTDVSKSSEALFEDTISDEEEALEDQVIEILWDEFFELDLSIDEVINFDKYCEENSWKIIIEDWKKACSRKEKVCLKSDYVNWVCKFKLKE